MSRNNTPALNAADKPAIKILLVTTCWWPALARLAQLLREMGCAVAILCPTGHPARVIAGVTVFEQRAFYPLRALTGAIARFDPVLVVPGDERALSTLHRLHRTGSAAERHLVETSLGPPESYPSTVSRMKILALARRLHIPTPEGQPLASAAELARWLAQRQPPWVLKLDGSWGGMGVVVAATSSVAQAAFRRLRHQSNLFAALWRMLIYRDPFWLADWLRAPPAEVSMQSFITGGAGDLAMFCWNGEVLALTMGETVTSLGENRPATVIRLINRPDFREAATLLAHELRLSGFYGLDFIIDAATDRALLLEMNPRPTALTNIRREAGRDLLGAMVTAVSGLPCPAPEDLPESPLVAYFPLAWQAGSPEPGMQEDVPWNDPALMAEMLRPRWPERRLLAKLDQACRQMKGDVAFRLKLWRTQLQDRLNDPDKPDSSFMAPLDRFPRNQRALSRSSGSAEAAQTALPPPR